MGGMAEPTICNADASRLPPELLDLGHGLFIVLFLSCLLHGFVSIWLTFGILDVPQQLYILFGIKTARVMKLIPTLPTKQKLPSLQLQKP